jgi:DNA-binding HxlR family transcriptional regulator
MPRLDTSDPHQMRHQNELLHTTVLGGVKIEGLDRMRVTLKVDLADSSRPPVRHNLDLYNDNQLEKFIRKVAEKHEVGTNVIAATLSELTGELEKYRLDKLKEQQAGPQLIQLTEEEQTQAQENLKAENLQEQTAADLAASGIIGEETNALILWYAMTSRKMHDPLSVICLAKSGTGKSYLQERVAACIPQEDVREQTQFTGASLYHFKREEIKGKVFLIEDMDGAQEVMFPIRELQTKKRISKTMTIKDRTGQLRTVTLMVEGPVSVIGCTTKEKIYEDNANRALLIYLDGSKEQDERIMDYQKQLRAGLVDGQAEKQIQQKLRHMQKVLEPVRVINPYAPLIDLPKELFKPRRALPLLLSFIEAVTFYHQKQREQKADEQTGEIYIETYPQDIEQAFGLLRDVLFRKSDELSGAAREFYQWLKNPEHSFTDPKHHKGKGFYAREVRQETRIHPRTLNRYLNELAEYGLLRVTGGNKNTTGYSYRLNPDQTFESLQKSIDRQVEQVIKAVWEAHQKQQPKRKPRKKSKPVSQQ